MSELFFESMADAIMRRIEKKLAVKKRIYSLDEAAEYLGLTPKALQQKAARGEIHGVRFDRLLRFDILDLNRYIADSKQRSLDAA